MLIVGLTRKDKGKHTVIFLQNSGKKSQVNKQAKKETKKDGKKHA